jgi:cytochrome c2
MTKYKEVTMSNNQCRFEASSKKSNSNWAGKKCKLCDREYWEHNFTMSNKKKLNSIDWLVEELRKYIEEPWKYVPKGGKEAIIKQAKAMHKEEIIDFAMKFMMQDRPIISFYNETFGGNNEQQ